MYRNNIINKNDIKSINVLIIYEFEQDAILIEKELEKSHYRILYKKVSNLEEIRKLLAEKTWDVILSDFKFYGFNAFVILNIFKEYLQMFQESYIASKEFKDTISRQLINLTIYLTLLEDIKFPPSEGLLEKAENMKENQVRPEKTYKFLAYYYLRTQASANRALQGAGNSRDDL